MTSPTYEQYPRPSVPTGPSWWEQPAFVEAADTVSPPVTVQASAARRHPPLQLPPRPTRDNYQQAVRSWALIALISAVLAVALMLTGVATQTTALFATAIVVGAGALIGVFETLAAVAKGIRARTGSSEDNG